MNTRNDRRTRGEAQKKKCQWRQRRSEHLCFLAVRRAERVGPLYLQARRRFKQCVVAPPSALCGQRVWTCYIVNVGPGLPAMSFLFHCAPVLLASSSVVLPGNYGRIIRETGQTHSHWHRETILEQVRMQRFPDKPSRLTSSFSCSSEATARCYRSRLDPRSILYVVEKVEPDAREHRADFNVVQPLARRSETMEQVADLYWRAALWCNIPEWPDIRCEEVVTSSPLRVIRQLS